jgi:hypothetical protein
VLGAQSVYLAPIFLCHAPRQNSSVPLYFISSRGGAFNLSFASMASNSKGKKKAQEHGDAPTAAAPVLPSLSIGATAAILPGSAAVATAGWWPDASTGSPDEVDSSQVNPCVNPCYLSLDQISSLIFFI